MILSLSRHEAAKLATGRSASLFGSDVETWRGELRTTLQGQRVLVVGGAGSIGGATVAELSRFDLAALHVVDIDENGLAELVRSLRGRPEGLRVRDVRTLPLDFGSAIMRRVVDEEASYDLVLNFAAVKHVRSEKDVYSLLHMLDTNVLKVWNLLEWLIERGGTQRYFGVSTDKAANPVNMMGATKRIMEHVMFAKTTGDGDISASSARFANVAFSNGSLLDGWLHRLASGQPLAVPRNTRRYFLSLEEAGQLCLLAAVCGRPKQIIIPRLDADQDLVELESVARALLHHVGFEAETYETEADVRGAVGREFARGRYPLLLTSLDTSGEKPFEEFVGRGESVIDIGLGNVRAVEYSGADYDALAQFRSWLSQQIAGRGLRAGKADLIEAVEAIVSEFRHVETNKSLDNRM